MAEHAGQWLFEEGMAYLLGSNFKKKDQKRGQSMIEASASSGFPMAVAKCHYQGWNGMEEDFTKAFEMFVKIEQETNGYHWAQYSLGLCYEDGHGASENRRTAVKWYTKSSEQGNHVAMNSLGICYDQLDTTLAFGIGKALELYEKSAQLGNSIAMFNLGACYEESAGVTKDLNTAREWYTKAAAQGCAKAQAEIDLLNASNN